MPSPHPIIVWFRDDLRLSDHPALYTAARTGSPVICLFVLDEAAGRPLGGAARWWLAQSLRALGASLGAIGGALVLRKGAAAKVIADVARESEAGAVYWNTIAQASHQAVEKQLQAALTKLGIDSRSFPGDLLVSPGAIRNKDGRGLRVFTPFWKRLLALGEPPKPPPPPKKLRPGARLRSDALEGYGLEPTRPDWAGSNPANWQWVAGCGADAAPYFRVFNPLLQGEKFDPDGTYVRRWVPELKELPPKLIHQPWQATPIELASAGITLGNTYPQPIVDHTKGRQRALAAYATIRKS